jgi:hypothetical protein
MTARRIPELPRDHASAVPDCILVYACVPHIDMPTEAINRLTAHAAEIQGPVCTRVLDRAPVAFGMWPVIRSCGRHPRARSRCSAVRCELRGAREAISTKRVRAPIRIDCEPRRPRHERPCKSSRQNGRWVDSRQRLGEARYRPPISFRLFR